jgi:hypothetical protein
LGGQSPPVANKDHRVGEIFCAIVAKALFFELPRQLTSSDVGLTWFHSSSKLLPKSE